jgi:hypothetical protein
VYAAVHYTLKVKAESETLEFRVCPYCFSKNIDEIHEQPRRVESIQSVKINEADVLLKQGYEVKDTYASSVTLVKYATPAVASEEKPTLKESQEAIDKGSEKLREDLKTFNEPLGKEKA